MPKRKVYPTQQTLFRREAPQMPEGYYSSGPNPNLRRFVEEHAKPYDPATDNYRANPYTESKDIENRRDPINDLQIYWSKKPYTAIRDYIRHYTEPGDIVLDPFCGSGGTALAALLEGRSVIASDLSPAATFITKNYCTPVNSEDLGQAYEALYRKAKQELSWGYCPSRPVFYKKESKSIIHDKEAFG
jgi:hypothetical protein